jgi:hypothetical protein
MKRRLFGSSVWELPRLSVCKFDTQQKAFQRRISTIFWSVENRQCRNRLAQIQAGRRQICRCRAFSKMAIPLPRQRTSDHGASLFFYKIARTTLLGRWNYKKSTQCNCCTIGPIHGSRAAQKARNSRRCGAYFLHIAARRRISRPRFGKPPRPRCHALTIRPVHCWPASGKHRG